MATGMALFYKNMARLVCAAAAMAVTAVLWAVEVTPEQAQTAAHNWVLSHPSALTAKFKAAKVDNTLSSKNDKGVALYHVVNLSEGGFVVTSGDTRQTPIVAYSATGSYVDDEINPLYAILQDDQAKIRDFIEQYEKMDAATPQTSRGDNVFSEAESEWEALLADDKSRDLDGAPADAISDVRVDKLIKTQWGQSKWGGRSSSPQAFNYRTPSNYVCGCVATAGAQIMKYWEWPKDYISSFTNNNCKVNGYSAIKYSIPGAFDWDNMPLSYALTPSISEAQQEAIGMLTYNVGVAVGMNWTKSSSSANTSNLPPAFKSLFNYQSGTFVYYWLNVGDSSGLTDFQNALYASLDAEMPVSVSIRRDNDGGHSIIADGYGYLSGTLYTHLNMGWNGLDDVWYNLVNESISCANTGYNYTQLKGIGFNIHPSISGDVISGRVLNSGSAVSDASVRLYGDSGNLLATTNANSKGIYSFRISSAGSYYVSASSNGLLDSPQIPVVISALSSSGEYGSGGRTGNKWGVDLTLGSKTPSEPVVPSAAAYQSLTNLGPCASSRVLLMNNDTNATCPIGLYANGNICVSGQGYGNSNETATVVGGTFWVHSDTTAISVLARTYLNLLPEVTHTLYQKTDAAGGKKALWTLVDCRAGSGGYHGSSDDNGRRNYLPWSDTCQPLDPAIETAPIPDTWLSGAGNLGGIKQVGQIIMRCTTDACVYSPFYEEGIGEIYFDAVNGFSVNTPDRICVEIATGLKEGVSGSFGDGLDWDDYLWVPVPCDMFVVEHLSDIYLPDENRGIKQLTLNTTKYGNKMYFRVRAKLNHRGPIRFRIRRLTNNSGTTNPDYNALILVDNIIASYPSPTVDLASAEGGFTVPFLSVGRDGVKPRMAATINTEGLLPDVDWQMAVSNVCFVWRYRPYDGMYGDWQTNTMSLAGNGLEFIGDESLPPFKGVGTIEYHYVAEMYGTHYEFFDFANNEQIRMPDENGGTLVRSGDYSDIIRAGESDWEKIIATAGGASVEMEIVSNHTWRGVLNVANSDVGKIVHFSFQGLKASGLDVQSRIWRLPAGTRTGIPVAGIASADLGGMSERDILIDHAPAQIAFEFNDETGEFSVQCTNNKKQFVVESADWSLSRSTSPWWWENFDAYAGNRDYPFNVPFGQNNLTPNGWAFDNGMYVNGFFTAQTNKTDRGMALQLQGGGAGSVGLIDSPEMPNGIGTVSFSARLAQTLDFDDFYCYLGGFTDKNYAFSAKATMTHTPQHNNHHERNDISTGCPSISLAAYYRPGYGCYEFRVSRIWAQSRTALWWNGNGALEIAIYRWNLARDSDGNPCWTTKKLASRRLGTNSTIVPASADRSYDKGNYLAPVKDSTEVDNDTWTSVYVAAYNTGSGTYVEGAISEDQLASYSGLSGNSLLQQAVLKDMGTAGRMFNIAFTDREIETNVVNGVQTYTKLYHEKGTYGVCSTECPAAFGALNRHALNTTGPYYNNASKFMTSELQRDSLNDEDWGTTSPGRMMSWNDFERNYPDKDSYIGVWGFGVCAAPVSQHLDLFSSPAGRSSDWSPTGLSLLLSSYQTTNIVFSPHTLEPVNLKLCVGNSHADVVVDDLVVSQWKAETSDNSLGEIDNWAYTGGWITTTTNDVYNNFGASTDDPVANITQCGFLKYAVEGTDNEYVYVFTNTTAGALGNYARFVPNTDLTVVGVFGIGGGGGGGAGGGGGGGGGGFQITNAANYTVGEELRVFVGLGGNSSGWNASASGGTPRAVNGSTYGTSANGGNSYFYGRTVGSANQTARTTYYGYGGGRGGNWRDTVLNSSGVPTTTYAQGQNGGSNRGGGGGSARPRAYPTNTTFTVDTDKLGTVNSRNQGCGAGAGVANVTEAAGGGGGGGLVTYTSSTVNFSNTDNVTYAGTDGAHGVAGAQAGNGGRGFPISAIGDEAIRKAIMKLTGLSENDRLGGGGGGGAGTNATANAEKQGVGSLYAGLGLDGGSDGAVSAATYAASFGAKDADRFRGGGGGGGAIHAVLQSGGNSARNWLTRGGRGGDGMVVLHVRVNDPVILLQPMRGDPEMPMSVRTPFLNGISLFSFAWKWADPNAVLHVQVATNDVNSQTVRLYTETVGSGWTDICDPIRFSEMSEDRRASGSMEVPLDIGASVGGLLRVLVEPSVVAAARAGASLGLDPMYGAVAITGMVVVDNPEKEAPEFANEIISTRVSGGKMVDVPLDWFVRYPTLGVDTNDVLACARGAASVATLTSANGRLSVADCYMVDLDPENETNDFKITSFPLKADGTPDIEHIVFDPPRARWNVPATYKVKGVANLNDSEWTEVTEENKGALRFFKVEVVLP